MILRQNQIRLTNLSGFNADYLSGRGAAQSSKSGSPREQGVRLACRRKELPKKRKLLLRREEKAHFEAHFFALDIIVRVITGENAHKIHFLREIKIDRRDIA